MNRGPHRALAAALCAIAAACASTGSDEAYFLRLEEKSRGLANKGAWAEVLSVSQSALADCGRVEWCKKDPRFRGAFLNHTGQAQEHLGRRDLAVDSYREAFYAVPLYFSPDYFRLLKEMGRYRLLRNEIDVLLASRPTSALPPGMMGPASCVGKWAGGIYTWTLRASQGGITASGKAVVSQSRCAVVGDLTSEEAMFGGQFLLKGDIGAEVASLAYGPPCESVDEAKLVLGNNGLTASAVRKTAERGCLSGPYVITFVKRQ